MDDNQQDKSWIVFLSTFPPRQCGIATFTADLTNTIDQIYGPSIKSKIIAMNPAIGINRFLYTDKIIFQINQCREEEYTNIANKLNQIEKIKLVNIQHEFGIFGGECGSYLLNFLEKLQKPIITTLHTIIPSPDEKMYSMVQSIMKYSKGIIVMTQSSKDILERDYGLDSNRIKVIPHGIHQVLYKTSEHAKSALGMSNKFILSTFGFLSPGKGIEYVIESMPAVVKKFPNARFLVAGVTHPAVLEQEGETYRNFLTKKVLQLGLNNNVRFYNTYYSINKLLQFLEATDIYISTTLNPNQAVSGTLSYALSSGRPVISTSFTQAKQDVTDAVGILVDFKNSQSYADAIIKLMNDKKLCLQMGKNAYFRTRHMTWENVAHFYVKYFSQILPELDIKQKKFPVIKLKHLAKLTDEFGIIQFAKLISPDPSSGYTVDDNARALIVTALYYKKFGTDTVLKLVSIYLNFICQVSKPNGYFDNYVTSNHIIDKQRNIQEYSEDPSARAFYALALISNIKELPKRFRKQARSLFEQSLQKNIVFSSPRAIAFYIKALYQVLIKWKEPKIVDVLRHYCDELMSLYKISHSSDWEWFEHYLTYSNSILPEALALGYKITGEKKYLEVSEKTLDFLIKHTFKNGMYMPIGQKGWFPRNGERQYFDQQPEDTAAVVETLKIMSQITNKKHYKELANIAFSWFLGNNVIGQEVYDRITGGCRDGIGENFVNLNEGAESTVSYLFARLFFEN